MDREYNGPSFLVTSGELFHKGQDNKVARVIVDDEEKNDKSYPTACCMKEWAAGILVKQRQFLKQRTLFGALVSLHPPAILFARVIFVRKQTR